MDKCRCCGSQRTQVWWRARDTFRTRTGRMIAGDSYAVVWCPDCKSVERRYLVL